MQGKVTEHFRQQKPHSRAAPPHDKKQPVQELPGAYGEAAVTNYDITEEERILRQFDLDTQYGPCTGLTRLDRWQRAEKFGLKPPVQVKEMLTGPQGEQWNKCLWDGRV